MSRAEPMDPVRRQALYRRGGRYRFTPRQHRRYFHKLNRFVRELEEYKQATQ
jgi:hypothetical protein